MKRPDLINVLLLIQAVLLLAVALSPALAHASHNLFIDMRAHALGQAH